MQDTMHRTSVGTKILSLILAVVLVLGFVPIAPKAALAASGDTLEVPAALTVIGADEDDEADVLYLAVDETYTYADFSALVGEMSDAYSMIAVINGDYCVTAKATAAIASYAVTADELVEGIGEYLDDSVAGSLDFTKDTYVFWIMNDEGDMFYVVLSMPSGAGSDDPVEPTYVTDETFTASVDGKVMTQVEKREGGYSFTNWVYDPTNPDAMYGYAPVTVTSNLYVVTIPAETKTVDLDFNGNQTWVYNYTTSGGWISGWYEESQYGSGPTSATVSVDADEDGEFDVIHAQNPYVDDISGGELRFAVTFVYDDSSKPGAVATDPATYAQALQGLVDRFVSTGDNHAINNDTWVAAVALSDLGLGGKIDVAATLESFAADDSMTAGKMAKYIMSLTAAGVDCTAVEIGEETRNLVDEMEEGTDFSGAYFVYSAVLILPVYKYGGYSAADDKFVDELVSYVVDNMAGLDNQTLAQAVLALIPYQESDGVSAALASAKAKLLAAQLADGGFANGYWSSESDPDTSGWATAALSALGVNVSKISGTAEVDFSSDSSENAPKTAADYLSDVCSVDSEGTVRVTTSYGEPMAASDVLIGLAAVSGQAAGDADYYVYNAQTVAPENPETPAEESKESAATETTASASTAKTGDTAFPFVLVVVMVGASMVLFASRRRHED